MHHPAADLVPSLLAASDADLERVLAAADEADIAMRTPAAGLPAHQRVVADGDLEIVLLGALGCRYGMLAGGAGGHLVRTAGTTLLVDPGPAALGVLVQLADRGLFDWRELDAIAVTHLHPDHYGDLIPTLEAMCSYSSPGARKTVLANPTSASRFAAFSPYHFERMADLVTLAHPDTDGDGKPAHTVGDLTVHATPALHLEEAGRQHSAIGLAYQSRTADVWYSSDTNLTEGLLDAVAALVPHPALVIAHADASNITPSPERGAACHLETRDIPAIAAALRPDTVLIQHYDAAYAEPEYRIAQAIWAQRQLDRAGQTTAVLPGTSGLRLKLSGRQLTGAEVVLPGDAGSAVEAYLRHSDPTAARRAKGR